MYYRASYIVDRCARKLNIILKVGKLLGYFVILSFSRCLFGRKDSIFSN